MLIILKSFHNCLLEDIRDEFILANKWLKDRNILRARGNNNDTNEVVTYVYDVHFCTTVIHLSEEDAVVFTLSFGNIIKH